LASLAFLAPWRFVWETNWGWGVKQLYQATRRVAGADRCELCATPLAAQHDHLYEVRARMVRCACQGCALIIPTSQTATYRRVPRRFERVELDAGKWLDELGVPVGVAALIRRDDGRVVVGYPGPAGLVESELDTTQAQRLLEGRVIEAEVEAIVLSSLPEGGAWIAGIDVVFEMIAELRQNWRGISGGGEAPAALARVIASHAGVRA